MKDVFLFACLKILWKSSKFSKATLLLRRTRFARKELLQFLPSTHGLYINKLVTRGEKIQNRLVTFVRKYYKI